jgi:hypothetical protein
MLCVLALLAGCGASPRSATTESCVVRELGLDETEMCAEGAVVLFAPRTFGNQQLPVIFVAGSCSFDHPIVANEGTVSCVFTRRRHESFDKAIKQQL